MQTLDPLEIPDLLANLVERSLVSFDQETGRYQMSESMRSFAISSLVEGESDQSQRKLFSWCLNTTRRFAENPEEVAPFLLEIDNARASLEWGMRTPGMETETLLLAINLHLLWNTAFFDEGRNWIRIARERAVDAEPKLLGNAEYRLGLIELRLGLVDDAIATTERGEAIAASLNDRSIAANMAYLRLWLMTELGDLLSARDFALECLERARQDGHGFTVALNAVGEISRELGDWDLAEKCSTELLQTVKGINRRNEAANLGLTLCRLGRLQESRQFLAEAFSMADQLGNVSTIINTTAGFAYIFLDRGDIESAGRLCGYSQKLVEKSPVKIEPPDQKDIDWILSQGREVGGHKFESAMAEGKGLTIEAVRKLVEEVTKS